MKRIIPIFSLLILINTCEDLEHTNPVDPNVNITAPTNLQLSQQNIHTVLLSWNFSGDKYDGFLIDRKIGSDSWQFAYDTAACEIHSYTDTSAVPTESHTYRIYAYADENQSSSISKDITLAFPAPENLQLTQLSDTTVALQWQDKSDGEDGFIINRKKDGGTWETEIKKTTATTWTDSTVSPGSAYSYQVKAYKGTKTSTAVESQYQNIFQAPSNLSATAIDDQSLRLNWMDNCGFESGFRIERNDGLGFIQIADLSADVTTYTDNGLAYGYSYAFRVKGFTNKSESDYSNELQVEMIIPVPINLAAIQIDDQSLQISWTDSCSFEIGYRIERNDGSGYMLVAEIGTDLTTYTDEGLTYGQSYIYRVKAFTSYNESDYSNESNAIVMIIPAPTNLTATIIDNETVQLTWNDNCDFETGYKVERKVESGVFVEIADLSMNIKNYTDVGLTFSKNYYYRVKAYTNINLSDYSEEVITNVNVVVDIDGNVYAVVKIGNQWWMAENLKVTHYRNGDAIPNVTDDTKWSNLTNGAYCNYDNDYNNAVTYGSLYNWYAVTDSRKIAPAGWHIPTNEEWQTLVDYLGGSSVAGGKMKESGTSHWDSPNTGATNESGFSALPSGCRSTNGGYTSMGGFASFLSSMEWYWFLSYDHSEVCGVYGSKRYGFAVRCVRD